MSHFSLATSHWCIIPEMRAQMSTRKGDESLKAHLKEDEGLKAYSKGDECLKAHSKWGRVRKRITLDGRGLEGALKMR
jgi:hypothetical protein